MGEQELFPVGSRERLAVGERVVVRAVWGDVPGQISRLFTEDGRKFAGVQLVDGIDVEVPVTAVRRMEA